MFCLRRVSWCFNSFVLSSLSGLLEGIHYIQALILTDISTLLAMTTAYGCVPLHYKIESIDENITFSLFECVLVSFVQATG